LINTQHYVGARGRELSMKAFKLRHPHCSVYVGVFCGLL
jgi:hypothetical protein